MATNNIKPFAIGNGANVTSQSDYEALAALLTGFQSGKASSAQINKALRQATFIASVLAQFISDKANVDVLDNGNATALMTNLIAALKANSTTDFFQRSNNLSEIATTGTAAQIAAAKLATRTNIGLESVIGQLANGGTFAACTSNGYYLVAITDPSSITDMPKFNGVNVLGSGFLFVSKSETSICQTYATSNGGTCSRFKLGAGSFSGWDFKYSAVYTPTITNLGIGDIGMGQTWRSFTSTERVNNVNYTNGTGRPIMVSVTSGTASTSRIVVDGVIISNSTIAGSSGGNLFAGSAIVPVNSVYQLTSSTPASSWAELR